MIIRYICSKFEVGYNNCFPRRNSVAELTQMIQKFSIQR